MSYNIFLACDGKYYKDWGINCIKSIQKYVPWIQITIHIVNPIDKIEIEGVKYFYENKNFLNKNSEIGYYQSVRFLKCKDYFTDTDLVMSIDIDTILTRSFNEEQFIEVCSEISVQRHQKDKRWMAGLVTYGTNNLFKERLVEELYFKPVDDWHHGWDQDVLEKLSDEFSYKKIFVGDWMSFGRGKGLFLTLKGDQKTLSGYLSIYKNELNKIHNCY